MKFYVMTDIHYYSKRNYEGDPYSKDRVADQLQKRESDEILKEALDYILKDGYSNTVLISGDLTCDGEVTSHEDLVKILREYTEMGLKFYVTTATHDFKEVIANPFGKALFHNGKARGYDKDHNVIFVDCMHRKDLDSLYKEFGRNEAVSENPLTMSYAVDLEDNIRLLALNDDFEFDPKTQLRGYEPDEYKWILDEAKKARAEGKTVIAMTHHPIITPSPLYGIIGKHDMLANGDKVIEDFADVGINVVFTGHSHIHDIGYRINKNGSPFYDVSTSALIGYPPNMRKVEIIDDTVKVETITLQTLSRFDLKGKTLPEYCKEGFFGMIENLITYMATDERKFAYYANAMSIRPNVVHKYWPFIRLFGKWVNNLTVGKVYKWVRKESGLTKAEVAPVKDKKVVPLILGLVENLYTGNASMSPDSPEYKVTMGVIALLDGIIKSLPIDLKKILGYSTLAEVVSPIVYNNGIDDYNAELDLKTAPSEPVPLPIPVSKKGPFIIVGAILLVLLALPLAIPATLIIALIMLVRNIFGGKAPDLLTQI